MLSAITFQSITNLEQMRKAGLTSLSYDWIWSPDISKVRTTERRPFYKFYPSTWRDGNNRSIHLRIREAIGYLTRYPTHTSYYKNPINIAFLPTRSAEEVFTLNHDVYMRVGHEFEDNEGAKFESYLRKMVTLSTRQKRSPTHLTEGYDTWRKR